MPRTTYCTVLDVVRRYEPTITANDLDSDSYITVEDRDTIQSRLEGVESEFEDDTGTALREVRVGSVGTPSTYEFLDAKRSMHFPTTYSLGHRNVLPIDASAGDAIEVRTSRDTWRDITADEGSRWVLVEPRSGTLEFYSRLRHTIQFRVRPGVRFIRLTYRYGALGGSPTEGGQTTLGTNVSGSSTPTGVAVADASRLPAEGGTMLVNGTEYVRVTNVDPAADTVDIAERGLRRTDETTAHSSGAVLHYCPMRVREAIAGKVAAELAMVENFVDRLVDTGEGLDLSSKIESWETEYQRAVARYSQWGYA